MNPAARSYRAVGATTRVTESDPHGLVLLLFDGALERIAQARGALDVGDRPRKLSSISGAMHIVDALRQSLNHEAGGDLARRLDSIYDYAARRLLQANVQDDAAALDEVAALLGSLRAAWAQIRAAA